MKSRIFTIKVADKDHPSRILEAQIDNQEIAEIKDRMLQVQLM